MKSHNNSDGNESNKKPHARDSSRRPSFVCLGRDRRRLETCCSLADAIKVTRMALIQVICIGGSLTARASD